MSIFQDFSSRRTELLQNGATTKVKISPSNFLILLKIKVIWEVGGSDNSNYGSILSMRTLVFSFAKLER